MQFLNVNELARVVIFWEVIEETMVMFMEFESLSLREADEFLRDVPLEANECCDKHKIVISLLLMPEDTQGFDTMKHFGMVIIIVEVALNESVHGSWDVEGLQIILVFRDRKDSLSKNPPMVDK